VETRAGQQDTEGVTEQATGREEGTGALTPGEARPVTERPASGRHVKTEYHHTEIPII